MVKQWTGQLSLFGTLINYVVIVRVGMNISSLTDPFAPPHVLLFPVPQIFARLVLKHARARIRLISYCT